MVDDFNKELKQQLPVEKNASYSDCSCKYIYINTIFSITTRKSSSHKISDTDLQVATKKATEGTINPTGNNIGVQKALPKVFDLSMCNNN